MARTKRPPAGSGENQWHDVVEEFSRESDRAGVILASARLEELLYELLERVLIPITGSRDDLLDADGPISTFSARIQLSYRMGLISAATARALNLIRKIRNSFAHEAHGVTLDAGAHRDRVRQLVLPMAKNKSFNELHKHFAKTHFRDKSDSAVDFYTAVAFLLMDLDFTLDSAEPIPTSTAPTGIADPETVDSEAGA